MNNDKRLEQLQTWLTTYFKTPDFKITVASADASFRRYFRIHANNKTFIAMDAPPEKEDCEPFVRIARSLTASGIHAPEIIAEEHEQGFLLLSDLGDMQYLSILNAATDEDKIDSLYKNAIDMLLDIQTVSTDKLPDYDRQLLKNEMHLFTEWFLGKHLNINLSEQQQSKLDTVFECLMENALQQPQVFVHRDYHSRNLMFVNNNNPGVIDFQDAVNGAITYDLASLLKDCYISWPREKIENLVSYYLDKAIKKQLIDSSFNLNDVLTWFDLMAVQRHLKAIGIFARLNIRDGKPGYLNDIPRTFSYIIDSCERYPLLQPLKQVMQEFDIAGQLSVQWKALP